MKAGFIIGVLWTIGVILTSKLNTIITDGQYASGIGIFFMAGFVFIALWILTTKHDVLTRKKE